MWGALLQLSRFQRNASLVPAMWLFLLNLWRSCSKSIPILYLGVRVGCQILWNTGSCVRVRGCKKYLHLWNCSRDGLNSMNIQFFNMGWTLFSQLNLDQLLCKQPVNIIVCFSASISQHQQEQAVVWGVHQSVKSVRNHTHASNVILMLQ